MGSYHREGTFRNKALPLGTCAFTGVRQQLTSEELPLAAKVSTADLGANPFPSDADGVVLEPQPAGSGRTPEDPPAAFPAMA